MVHNLLIRANKLAYYAGFCPNYPIFAVQKI